MKDSVRRYSLWWYYALSVTFILVSVLLLAWYVADRFSDFYVDQQRDSLEVLARTVSLDIEENGFPRAGPSGICSTSKKTDETLRMTLIDTAGVVVCDSFADPAGMENHGNRPEVMSAYNGITGSGVRFSSTVNNTLLYVAVPLHMENGTWVVRSARSLAAIDSLLQEVFRKLSLVTTFLVLAVFLVSVYLFRKINLPLDEIRQGAERFAQGEFERELPGYQVKEISELAKTMNQMAAKLDRLENLRREFVANVSHELKTPVTTIKGFTETLIGGAKDDTRELDRFLGIILRQTDRLAAIIDDLLTLSRLESAPLSEVLALEWHELCDILHQTAEVCQVRAEKKDIDLRVECNTGARVYVDRSLLMQAIINLVDNAVNYSPARTTVRISVQVGQNNVRIDVHDEGPGIMEIHLPRLFERFYRADKARSRKLGGTGLGLAIVKHIANVHRGEVSVTSSVGAGSTFTILLPGSG